MAVLDPERIPQVALEAMNKVHDEEVGLINALAAGLEDCAAGRLEPAALDERLEELLGHMAEHFAGEEARMRDSGFPPYPIHKAEHDRVLAEGRAVWTQWRQQRDLASLRTYVEQTLPAWLLQHVSTMDRVTAQFLVRSVETARLAAHAPR